MFATGLGGPTTAAKAIAVEDGDGLSEAGYATRAANVAAWLE
jgi:hypothetical protein